MRAVAMVAVIVVASGQAAVVAQKDKAVKQVVVQGKTIREWTKQLADANVLDRVKAVNALMQAGPEARAAAPALLALYREKDATLLQPLAAVALARMGGDAVPELRKALDDKSPAVRAGAALTLGQIGDPARDAVPGLTAALKDGEGTVREAAAQALGRLGGLARSAGPALAAALDDRDAGTRLEAALALWRVEQSARGVPALMKGLADDAQAARALAALGEIGPKAAESVAAIRTLLIAKEPANRVLAAETVYRVTGDAKAAFPILERALASKEPAEARAAASALGVLGSEEALARLLTDRNADLRREAASALSEKGGARKALEAGLADRDPGVRWWCAVTLASGDGDVRRLEEDLLRAFRSVLFRVGDDDTAGKNVLDVQASGRAVPPLIQILKSRPVRLQVEAARALAELGLDARAAREALTDALRSDDKPLRRAAAEALAALGVEALGPMVKLTSDADARLREGAARTLGHMGVQARSALPTVARLVKDVDPSVRAQAAMALWRIDRNAEIALAMLNLVLKDVDNKDRWEAVEGIGTIGVEARPPIKGIFEVLASALEDRDPRVRYTAAKWLWRRTRDSKPVVPLVRDGAADRDTFARQIAVETLGEMSTGDRVVPLLAQALDDREVGIRLAATEGLARGGADVVPLLVEALKSKNARVRLGVARALVLMGPGVKPAREALQPLAKDSDSAVRAVAEGALAE